MGKTERGPSRQQGPVFEAMHGARLRVRSVTAARFHAVGRWRR